MSDAVSRLNAALSGRYAKPLALVMTQLALTLASGASCGDAALEVVPYASVDQVFSEPIFRLFEEENGIPVRAVFDTEETKSTGVLNRIIAEAQAPQADVFWSGDPARAFLLIGRGLVEPYRSPNADRIPPEFRSEDGMWTGFAARARVLLVNTDLVGETERPVSIPSLPT